MMFVLEKRGTPDIRALMGKHNPCVSIWRGESVFLKSIGSKIGSAEECELTT